VTTGSLSTPREAATGTTGGTGLLLLVVFCVFGVAMLPPTWHLMLYASLYTVIFVLAAFAIEGRRGMLLGIAVTLATLEWLTFVLKIDALTVVSHLLNGVFFLYVVGRLILQIARTRAVNARIIMSAVNGYLLLGLAASLAVSIVVAFNPEAISFPDPPTLSGEPGTSRFSNFLYYGFVTLTTVGYGDVVPRSPQAKSLATFIGVTGQLYVAIIIATLVGKWAASHRD
jgi:hypothetical protein